VYKGVSGIQQNGPLHRLSVHVRRQPAGLSSYVLHLQLHVQRARLHRHRLLSVLKLGIISIQILKGEHLELGQVAFCRLLHVRQDRHGVRHQHCHSLVVSVHSARTHILCIVQDVESHKLGLRVGSPGSRMAT